MAGDQQAPGQYPGQQAYSPQPGRPVAKPRKLPTEPAPYQHLLRGPAFRWWKPLLVVLLAVAFALLAQVLLTIIWLVLAVATGGDMMSFFNGLSLTGPMDALTFSYVTAGLIAFIPSAMFANWIVHGTRPGYLSSVAGRIRWRWLLRCVAFTVPVFVVYMALQFVIGWEYGPRPPQWVALLIIVVIAIPFQSAGEEYAFRGLILQNVGGWFRHPVVALVVSIIPSVLLFALAHGSLDIWILCDLAIFATAACLLTWRTGGMEAAIVLHATNNVLIMISTILFGGWEAAFISTDSEGSPLAVLMSLVVESIVVALILWQAKRLGIQHLYQPSGVAIQPAAAAR